jgi:hypothetical protein
MSATFAKLLMFARLGIVLLTCGSAFAILSSIATAQALPTTTTSGGQLPEPIYWKQDLFLVPYHWGSAAEPAAARAVSLFVSKDRGTTWQKLSDARPEVRAFNYRAEGEGEYWFAIRTQDHQGRVWPAGPYQPELRVIVDTTMPKVDELRANLLPNGIIDIGWRCSDANLDAATLTIESQIGAADAWQPVPGAGSGMPGAAIQLPGIHVGQFQWQAPMESRPVAIRAIIKDLAGNSATYRAEVGVGSASGMASTNWNATPGNANALILNSPVRSEAAIQGPANPIGWAASSAPTTPAATTPVNQSWPATATSRAPFRLSSVGTKTPDDGVTAYGDPPAITAPAANNTFADSHAGENRVEARYASAAPIVGGEAAPTQPMVPPGNPDVAPVGPFRQASIKRLPSPTTATAQSAATELSRSGPPVDSHVSQHLPPEAAKRVGSRTFALEYDLVDEGRWGVSQVTLWGTRDGGKTWHTFARDDDNRSPLVATVDDEGLYGFRIVVDSVGGAPTVSPTSGDAPELWVAVDLQRPVIELTAIERGEGNLSDHLIFHWKAEDDNLEPRPIALFYSSRPAGPWSAIATNLEDTGEYAWRVERHVPERFYVRAEARDNAGNLAAFQTRAPIEFAPRDPAGHLRSAEPAGPTAVGSDAAYR